MNATIDQGRELERDFELEAECSDVFLPSPSEIERACDEIQSRWTPKERRKRRRWAGTDVPDWVVPEYTLSMRDVA